MTLPPDTEMAASKDPADDRPKPLLGVTFWAMILLMAVCVTAGVLVATVGPRLFGPKPAASAAVSP